jgi:cell wall-associated NlpC family hydrolase
MRKLACVWIVTAICLVAGCASSRSVPRPFPGAAPGPERPPAAGVPDAPGAAEAPAAPVGTPVVSTALAFRGVPYRNGGSDPSGFDCSGFVQYVFASHGLRVPREVRDQFQAAAPVDRDDIQPGDLVFFETVSRGPSHVGIAIGGSEFVHAPSSRGVVRVERFTTQYWAERWIGARRL